MEFSFKLLLNFRLGCSTSLCCLHSAVLGEISRPLDCLRVLFFNYELSSNNSNAAWFVQACIPASEDTQPMSIAGKRNLRSKQDSKQYVKETIQLWMARWGPDCDVGSKNSVKWRASLEVTHDLKPSLKCLIAFKFWFHAFISQFSAEVTPNLTSEELVTLTLFYAGLFSTIPVQPIISVFIVSPCSLTISILCSICPCWQRPASLDDYLVHRTGLLAFLKKLNNCCSEFARILKKETKNDKKRKQGLK